MIFNLLNHQKAKKIFAIYSLGLIVVGLFANHTQANPESITLTGTIRDFQASHPDFEFNLDDGDNLWWNNEFEYDRGIVTNTIGSNRKPVYAHSSNGTISTSGETNFNQWYNDVPGVNQQKEHSITLSKQADGMYQYSSDNFFPINGELFGNLENDPSIIPPTSGWMRNQWDSGKSGNNYHFTYEIHKSFTYQGGETFTFEGDDDVWVYINDQKVIDIGGVHGAQTQTVNIDDLSDELGLVIGNTYDFDFFFAERNFSGSNFKITTSLELIESITPIVNQPPEATDDVVEDRVRVLTLDVLANDFDQDLSSNPNELITITSVQNVTGGSATISDQRMIVYTPTNGTGNYSLEYIISDNSGAQDTATVTIDLFGVD